MLRNVICFVLGMLVASVAFYFLVPPRASNAEGAAAAAGGYAVVDVQKVMAEAKAGQDLQKQVTALQEDLQKEVKKYEDELKADEKKIQDKQKTATKEELTKDLEALQKKAQEIRQKIQDRKVKVEQGVGKSLGELREKLLKIIADIAMKNDYRLVLNKQNTIISHQDLEITDEVMNRLNDEVSSIKVDAN